MTADEFLLRVIAGVLTGGLIGAAWFFLTHPDKGRGT